MKKLILFVALNFFLLGCDQTEIINTSHISNTSQNEVQEETNAFIESQPIKTESEIPDEKKIAIYLNPSVQIHNMFYDNSCSEAEAMNIVANKIYSALSKDARFIVYINNNMKKLSESVKESNSLKVDYHLALHTNAGGGSGSECYYVNNSSFASNLLTTFTSHHYFPSRGIKNGNTLYELKNSTAKNKALIEFLFHDNAKEAEFIKANYDLLAASVVETFTNIANSTL